MKKRKKINTYRLKYIKDNWKLIIHFLFRTYHFGVDNNLWSKPRSLFGLPFYKRWHLIREYKAMRFRAYDCYFIQKPELLFPKYHKKRRGKYEKFT